MRWTALWLALVSGLAAAESDLLKVGKTPAEKLDEKVEKAKDNAQRALEKLRDKNRVLTETLYSLGEAPAPAPALPDPTAPDETFQQTFRALLRGRTAGGSENLPPLPAVELGALVLKQGEPPAALLKIDGEAVLVKDGEEVSLIRQGQTMQLRVQTIDAAGVRLLVLPHNELLSLH